ncbi:MAG: hypothetical protein K9K82_12475 [Desulfobacteraceae bacterium]|nr:hypothetical protein [Desulfobacteraceae bacterium]
MQLDLYTSEDRAMQAIGQFMAEQKKMYWTWVFIGSYIAVNAILIVVLLFISNENSEILNSNTIYAGEEIVKNFFEAKNESIFKGMLNGLAFMYPIVGQLALLAVSTKLLTIGALLYAGIVIAARFFVQIVAFYQGIIFGLLSGAIFGGIGALIGLGLQLSSVALLATIFGVIGGLIVLVMGTLGAFLPASR